MLTPGEQTAPADASEALARLEAAIAPLGSVLVAFSAGVDSSVVLAVARRVLGRRAEGLIGVSASVPAEEVEQARRLVALLDVHLNVRDSHELDNADYVANAPDRCFHCKSGLYALCLRVAAERGLRCLANGTNADDVGDWRPGLIAAREAEVHSPLLLCGLGKAQVRAVAARLGLPNADKPAQPCLASRLPYGTAVTRERLAAVATVERHLRARGFREVRARHHGARVRLEVEPRHLAELHAEAVAGEGSALLAVVRAAGFTDFEIQADGFRSGRLNDALRVADAGAATPSAAPGDLHAR